MQTRHLVPCLVLVSAAVALLLIGGVSAGGLVTLAVVLCCPLMMLFMMPYAPPPEDYLARLRKIEGQVRGLQRLIDGDTPCIDVVTQIASVTGALHAVALLLLDEHLPHCVMEAATAGDPAPKLAEAGRALERLMRLWSGTGTGRLGRRRRESNETPAASPCASWAPTAHRSCSCTAWSARAGTGAAPTNAWPTPTASSWPICWASVAPRSLRPATALTTTPGP